jgi:hypothetical protein
MVCAIRFGSAGRLREGNRAAWSLSFSAVRGADGAYLDKAILPPSIFSPYVRRKVLTVSVAERARYDFNFLQKVNQDKRLASKSPKIIGESKFVLEVIKRVIRKPNNSCFEPGLLDGPFMT